MKKILLRVIVILIIVYATICLLLFAFQEKLIFFPEKLGKEFQFNFQQPFQEMSIQTSDNKILDGILFKADSSRGLIFYLHGNGGSLNGWGGVAKTYGDLGYDVFMPDYRGYGKSEGSIRSQQQFFEDMQDAYNEMKKRYAEDRIIVLGYSIGTGPAAKIASTNHPRLLILQAPYYSLTDMMRNRFPFIPTFILKYKFETFDYLRRCTMPVIIFHGDADEVIYYNSSVKLKENFKSSDTLITLSGQGHNGMTDNPEYVNSLKKILSRQ
jgi:pimeloyl-ACP methyl ester carboxylesterase